MQEKMADSPAGMAEVAAPYTTALFVLIAVLAVLAVAGLFYGARLRRMRREATRDLEERGHLERLDDAGVADPDAPGEAVAPRPDARTDEAAPGGDTDRVVQVPQEDAGDAQASANRTTDAAVATPQPTTTPTPVPTAPAGKGLVSTAPVAGTGGSDLTLLKGLGPKVAAQLTELGVADIAALAALDDDAAARIAAQLGPFAPRMERDRWREQAQLLASGDRAGFEARFGKL